MIRKSRFVSKQFVDIKGHYQFITELGNGCFGKVFQIKEKFSGEIRACKVINKNRIKQGVRFKTEIELLKTIDHPNIVKLLEIYEDETNVYLVMEECTGGLLFNILSSKSKTEELISELEAANLFKQIISALNYLHKNGISHRDLKPENILFHNKNENHLKVIDFGLSKIFKMNPIMNSVVGTSYYMSPEMIRGEYNEKCDIWSAGIILHFMLCGRPPFISSDQKKLEEKILNFNFDCESFQKNLSKEAQDLFEKIFVSDDNRISSEEILGHDWINKLSPHSNDKINSFDFNYFHEYSEMNKLKKSIISFITYRFNFIQTQEMSKIFQSLDKNSDGCLGFEEFEEGISKIKNNKIFDFSNENIKEIFDEVDLDKNGTINYSEFISSTIQLKKELKIEHVMIAFRNFDTDKNGKISLQELTDVIKPITDTDVDYLKDLIKKFDINGDGEIDIKEFVMCLGLSFS